MAQFKAGDVVELNSGGPDMTVESVKGVFLEKDHVECIWFDGHKLRSRSFATVMLRKSGWRRPPVDASEHMVDESGDMVDESGDEADASGDGSSFDPSGGGSFG